MSRGPPMQVSIGYSIPLHDTGPSSAVTPTTFTFSHPSQLCINAVTRASADLDPWPITARPENIVLVVAGLFQFTPWKDACLSQCQAPLVFIQRQGGFRREPTQTGGARAVCARSSSKR